MESEMKIHRGRHMKDLRRQRGLSLNALASMVMVDPSTISRWETRREFIHIARFIQALYALGVTPEEFLGLENPYPAMEEVAA
ncbi:MAG: helix-turn-helix transcriptional regulator [Planctomycetes bacterium]|jgi:transcriptional regulator with XRE-family HTH domain|nr:helix-turn-helix transcriptional regulator [Planctomycetota bacterium]